MTEYKLINPYIEGKFQKLFSGKSPSDAAQEMWNKLSEHITNCVPEFAFTIERVKDNKMFHFRVNETVKNNEVDYSLTELDIKLSAAKKKKFLNKLNEFKDSVQKGGKKRRRKKDEEEEEEEESTSSEYYDSFLLQQHVLWNQPITYFWYYPEYYTFEYEYFFVPTWVYPLSPYTVIVPY